MEYRYNRFECQGQRCSFMYEERFGHPETNIPPGTLFEKLPDTWVCPKCGGPKRNFQFWSQYV
ncbi:rubredoxin [Polyangium jinanense]|uniref:Rubredoxin n=2 Tax=Polyangium jinanense TaxID=2829994 RepID=A0A9X4AUA7_9BACT|nr:rubredoxin [Polyangium jinanense]MDC3958617.1 rubredoxin [Polyangium jinanense]MDC3983075.1 rubredoxin [Polyangium jinanense]